MSRRENQESSLNPASAKMCVAGRASNGPSRRLKFYNHASPGWRRLLELSHIRHYYYTKWHLNEIQKLDMKKWDAGQKS